MSLIYFKIVQPKNKKIKKKACERSKYSNISTVVYLNGVYMGVHCSFYFSVCVKFFIVKILKKYLSHNKAVRYWM